MKRLSTVISLLTLLMIGMTFSISNIKNIYTQIPNEYIVLKYIEYRCQQESLPIKLVHSLIQNESNWKFPENGKILGVRLVKSNKKAYGLMQLQLSTAVDVMMDSTLTEYDLMTNDVLNIDAGIRYLVWLRKYYHGNIRLTLAAYNRGIKRVNNDLKIRKNPLNNYVYSVLK